MFYIFILILIILTYLLSYDLVFNVISVYVYWSHYDFLLF